MHEDHWETFGGEKHYIGDFACGASFCQWMQGEGSIPFICVVDPFQFGSGYVSFSSRQNQFTTVVSTPTIATHLPTRTPLKPLASKLSIGYLHCVAIVVVNSNPGQGVSYRVKYQ